MSSWAQLAEFYFWCSCALVAYCGVLGFLLDPSVLDSVVLLLPFTEHPTLRAMAWAAAHRERVLSHPLCVSLPYMVTGFLKKMPPPCQRFLVGRWLVALQKKMHMNFRLLRLLLQEIRYFLEG